MNIREKLNLGDTLRLVNDHNPKPLHYEFLAERKGEFEWDAEEKGGKKMPLIELSKYEAFSKEKPGTKLLYNSNNVRLVLFSLEPGQKVEPHTVQPQVSMLVVSGKGKMIIGNNKFDVRATHRQGKYPGEDGSGFLAVCESMESHGFEADERMVVLAIITPSPK